jgi:hypothetical protein
MGFTYLSPALCRLNTRVEKKVSFSHFHKNVSKHQVFFAREPKHLELSEVCGNLFFVMPFRDYIKKEM